jgi:hypothetical protein
MRRSVRSQWVSAVTEGQPSLIGVRVGSSRVPINIDDVRDALRRRSGSLHARGRVAEAMLGLALDMVGDDPRLTGTDRDWLLRALAGPVNEATDEALSVLLQEMARALRQAPAGVRPAIVAARSVSRTDFE